MLSLFNKKEVRNFIEFGKRNPYVFLKSCMEFLFLSFQGIRQRLTYALIRDKHALDKTRPQNIFLNTLNKETRSIVSEIFLPVYIPHSITFDILEIDKNRDMGDDGDLEVYYAANRWSHCINALFKDGMEIQNAIDESLEWINKKIPKVDKAWEPYSSSERVANLIVLLAKKNVELNSASKIKVVSFLNESIHWIDNHLEHYHSQRTNNHILNNCRAMILAGVVIDDWIAVERGLLLFAEI